MPARWVIVGQDVSPKKLERSRQLRREMTSAEKMLWQRLRNNQVLGLRFRRQQVISGFIVDFYCHAAGVIVNVDGGVHNETAEADAERDTILTAHGLVSLHITNEAVLNHLDETVSEIEAACRAAFSDTPDASESRHTGTPPRAGEGPGVRSAA